MAIIKWDPFRELESVRDSIDRFFEVGPKGQLASLEEATFSPSVNIYEENNNLVVEAEMPGVKEDEVDIEVHDDNIQIKAEHKEEKEEKKRNYFTREVKFGSFSRTIPLPKDVNREKAEAEFKNGVLKIIVPKKKISAPKTLKLKPK